MRLNGIISAYSQLKKEDILATLLIVDDELDIREFAANFFRKRKINVLTAGTGEEAIEALRKNSLNLILLDITMPGIDGIETLKRIRTINDTVKVIMVTGKKPDDGESFDKCKQYGAFDYVHKPLELDELEKIVLKELI